MGFILLHISQILLGNVKKIVLFFILPCLVHLTELEKVPESVNPVCRKYFGLFHPGVPVPQGKQVG